MHERPSAEIEAKPRQFLILDLDGVVLRWPQFHTLNPDAYVQMAKHLQDFRRNGGAVSVLTNRPPSEMQPVAYYLGEKNGLWITEGGGSLYDVGHNTQAVLPQWKTYASHDVPRLRQALQEQGAVASIPFSPDEAQFLPGMGYIKTVIVPPKECDIHEYAMHQVAPVLEELACTDRFRIDVGKAIDIDPRGLSKREGIQTLLSLHTIDPHTTPTVFIADHNRDIDAASQLLERGGLVAAVGNASDEYKQFVQDHGGFVANSSYHDAIGEVLQTIRTI